MDPKALRTQLLLSQIRLMELEDSSDVARARCAELEGLLQQAITQLDAKSAEAAHLMNLLAQTREQVTHTQQAEREARQSLAAAQQQCAALETENRLALNQLTLAKSELAALSLRLVNGAEQNAPSTAEGREASASTRRGWPRLLRTLKRIFH
jgi:hypothetical protein